MIKYRLLKRYGTSNTWNLHGTYNASCGELLRMLQDAMTLAKFGYEPYNIDLEIVDEGER